MGFIRAFQFKVCTGAVFKEERGEWNNVGKEICVCVYICIFRFFSLAIYVCMYIYIHIYPLKTDLWFFFEHYVKNTFFTYLYNKCCLKKKKSKKFKCYIPKNNLSWKRKCETLIELCYNWKPSFLIPSGHNATGPVWRCL